MIRTTDSMRSLSSQQAMADLRAKQTHLGQQTTGRRILSPADDPLAASQAISIVQSLGSQTQFSGARKVTEMSLAFTEAKLDDVSKILGEIKLDLMRAANRTNNDGTRHSIAKSLEGRFEQLVGIANTKDPSGRYMFAGNQTGTTPFVEENGRITYKGDSGEQRLQIDSHQTMSINVGGEDIFMRASLRNGGDLIIANANNTGTAIPSLIKHRIGVDTEAAVTFSLDAGGQLQYQVDGGAASPFKPGMTIDIDGAQLKFGEFDAPAAGDSFTLQAAAKTTADSAPDLFSTLSSVITALRTTVDRDPTGGALQQNAIGIALSKIDNTLSQVSDADVSIGIRKRVVEELDIAGRAIEITLRKQLSSLEDADLGKLITDQETVKIMLETSMWSHAMAQRLSLMDYLK